MDSHPDTRDALHARMTALQHRMSALRQQIREDMPPSRMRDLQAHIGRADDDTGVVEQALRNPDIRLDSSDIRIVDVERTQSIQYFNFNGQGSGAGPDNSIPLFGGRALVLRTYLDCDTNQVDRVTGKVTYERVYSNGTTELLGEEPPINGPIPATKSYFIDRGNTDSTLNFNINPFEMRGRTMRFTITAFNPAWPNQESEPYSFVIHFERSLPRPGLHIVPMRYEGDTPIEAPDFAESSNSLDFMLQSFPIEGMSFTGCTEQAYDWYVGSYDGWTRILDLLRDLRAGSGRPDDLYLALVPSNAPTYGGILGVGGYDGVAVAFAEDGPHVAHEMGHALGRIHSPPAGTPITPNYPEYDSYPEGSIGEFGFNRTTSEVYDPADTFDVMSWSSTTWMSPYTYLGLISSLRSRYTVARAQETRMRDTPRETLYLSFNVIGREVEFRRGFHLQGPAPVDVNVGVASPVTFELVGEDGRRLFTHRCRIHDPYQDPTDPYLSFYEAVPWVPETRAIVFRRDGEIINEVEIDDEEPAVSVAGLKRIAGRDRAMNLEWSGRHREPLRYLIRYSHDAGLTWRTIAADLTEPRCSVDVENLPGGDECLLQVVAVSAGIRSASARSEPFAVPRKPRRARILSPKPGTNYTVGEPVALWGAGLSADFDTSEPEEGMWTSSLDGFLGSGYELITHRLSEGRHRITLSTPDGVDGETSASVRITVTNNR